MLKALVNWFKKEKRSLPWRTEKSAYRVLVSEVMLQQTQASVVIPYFERWMKRFPTLRSLAEAKEEEVIKMWEGLGYYKRARSLHAIAKQLIDKGEEELPEDADELLKLKGIGPYTAGAILSFAFHKKAAAVDGNVLRVLARLLAFEEDISSSRAIKTLQQETLKLLPDEEPYVAMEALIELGALICKKKPLCEACPLAKECSALKEGKEEILPLRKERPKTVKLKRYLFLIRSLQGILVKQVEKGQVMEGLYEFPYSEEEAFKLFPARFIKNLPKEQHSFTRYQVELIPALYETSTEEAPAPFRFVSIEELHSLPFSSGHRRVLSKSFKYL